MQTNNALLTPGTTRSDGALPKQPFAIKAVGYIAFALLGFSFASVICLTFAASLAPKVSDCQARLDKISDAMQECDPNSSHIVDIAWLRLVGNGNLQLTKTWMLAFVAFIVGAIGVLAMVKTNGMAAMGSAAGNCLLWPIAGGLAASTQVAFVLLKQVCSAHGYGGPDGKNHHECVSFFNNQESQMIAQESANCPSLAAIGTKAYIADELWCHNARDGLLEPSEDHCSCECRIGLKRHLLCCEAARLMRPPTQASPPPPFLSILFLPPNAVPLHDAHGCRLLQGGSASHL